jgi:hypothetical protein
MNGLSCDGNRILVHDCGSSIETVSLILLRLAMMSSVRSFVPQARTSLRVKNGSKSFEQTDIQRGNCG